MTDDAMLTVRDVAVRMRTTEETVRRWLRAKQLRGLQFGPRSGYRIPESELRRFIAQRLGPLPDAERIRPAAA